MAEPLRLCRRNACHCVPLERPNSSRAPCYGVRRPVLEDLPAATAARPKELECSSARARGTRRSITTLAAWSAACAGRSAPTATSSSDPLRVGRCRYFGISWNTRRCRFASPIVGAEAPLSRRARRTQRRATLCRRDEAAHRAPTGSFRRIGNSECIRAGADRRSQQLTDCWCVVFGGRCCAQRRLDDLSGDVHRIQLALESSSELFQPASAARYTLGRLPVSPVLLEVSAVEGASQHAVETAPGFSDSAVFSQPRLNSISAERCYYTLISLTRFVHTVVPN